MPTINKQSVRDEFDRLQEEFKQLSNNKKIPPETATLFNGLMMLLNLMFAIFLEKSTKKHSKNSSIPPSQTKKDETLKSVTKTNGKGKTETVMALRHTSFSC